MNPAAVKAARDGKRHALRAIGQMFIIDTPKRTTDGEIATTIRQPKQDVRNLRLDMLEIGSLKVERANVGKTPSMNWTLLDPIDLVEKKLERKWADDDRETARKMSELGQTNSQRMKGVPAAQRHTNGHSPDETVAIVGPDAPKPLAPLGSERYDEPRALVEAGRQYASLHKQVDTKMKELEALGIVVDRERLTKTIQLPNDPRLVAIAQTIPYIEQIERQVERLTLQNTDLREKVATIPDITRERDRLRDQNQRLIAERAARPAQETDRPPVVGATAAAGR